MAPTSSLSGLPAPASAAIVPAAGEVQRLALIEQARQRVMYGRQAPAAPIVEEWIERSWRRCLAQGLRPEDKPAFGLVSAQARRRARDANHQLREAAQPVMERLGRAIAGTRYFAILTNQDGVVVDVHGPVDHSDRRAQMIARIGVDLSERQAGTTAVSAALAELRPVWLHRGEHFFNDNGVFSCAGAPLFGPDGACAGMLDLTAIEAAERPELRHLVAQAARSLENALTLRQAHSLLLHLNWPGCVPGDDSDGLVCLDADGAITGANQAARQMLGQLLPAPGHALPHANEIFAIPFETLHDRAARPVHQGPLDVPLWSGLRLQVWPQLHGQPAPRSFITSGGPPSLASGPTLSLAPAPVHTEAGTAGLATGAGHTPPRALRDIENALIHNAVTEARGNVLRAAKALGISRATVYRRLGLGKRSGS
ncbi:MAG: helix-turn-helix domain-containing protein [Polaromonas sp.]|nr:helix-turn-helix domain-containing protein [Polaromonas sp.]